LVWLEAYVPLLDEDFKFKIELSGRTTADAEFLKKDFDDEMQRFRAVKSKAASAKGQTVQELVQRVEDSPLLQEVKETLAAAKADPDAAAKCEKRLLELKLRLDEVADALEWPALVAEAHDWLGYLNKIAEQHGTGEQRKRAERLAEETKTIVQEQRSDRLRKRIEQIEQLYWEIAFAQPGFWVHQFQRMEKEIQKMSDQTRAARLLDQGRDCMSKNNITGLQNVVRQLWVLLPNDVVQAAQRGFQAGLVR
jgi:molecular chaperone DnaK